MEDSNLRHAYAALDLSPPVTEARLKRRYKALVRRWHPDRYQSDPIGQAEATERLRNINLAYELVSALLGAVEPAQEEPLQEVAPPRQEFVPPGYATERQFSWSPERVDAMVDSINQLNGWSVIPDMSVHRWLSLGALFGYLVVASKVLPIFWPTDDIVGVACRAAAYFCVPMFLIWHGDNDSLSNRERVFFRLVGWLFMALPANAGMALWVLWLMRE